MLEGPLSFHLSRCLYVQIYVLMYVCMYWCKISSTSKGKPSFSNENAMTSFRQTWYVGSGGTQVLPTWSVVTDWAYLIPHLHICFDWLITKKSYPKFSWVTLMKLGMWVVMCTSTTHVVCHHRMRIFNTSFAYLFWLANNKKSQIFRVLYGLHWWNLVCGKWWAQVLPMWSVVNECAHLIPHWHICFDWLITKKSYIQSSHGLH